MWTTIKERYIRPTKSKELILRLGILALVYLWAFSIRLVSTTHTNCSSSGRCDFIP
jgi:hypothetical protein